jgi:hypothetical protein
MKWFLIHSQQFLTDHRVGHAAKNGTRLPMKPALNGAPSSNRYLIRERETADSDPDR